MQDEPKKRRWQFSIRDVLLLMLSVGLAAAWYVDHHRLADELVRQQQQPNWIWFTHPNSSAVTVEPVESVYTSDLVGWWYSQTEPK